MRQSALSTHQQQRKVFLQFFTVFIVFLLLIIWRRNQFDNIQAHHPAPPPQTQTIQEDRTRPVIVDSNVPSEEVAKVVEEPTPVYPNEPPAKLPKDFTPVRVEGQAKRGYESMITQLARPLQCVKTSRWRGPNIKSPSVETRLDEALATRKDWAVAADKAVEYCGNGKPMMVPDEYGFLLALLRPGDLMLEWGSGRSSCVWATTVGELHSVDDSSTWVGMFRASMNNLENQVIHWMPSFQAAGTARPPSSLDEYHLYMNVPFFIAPSCFKASKVKFDVILVDGRVRPQCAYQALLLLKRDGVLMIHDWETEIPPFRPFYRIVLRWFELLHTEGMIAVFRIRPDKTGPEQHANPGVLPKWWTKTQKNTAWNMMLLEGVAYTEPFDEPHMPTSQERKRVRRDWRTVSAAPDFKRTQELFNESR